MMKNLFLVSCAVLAVSGIPYYAQDISTLLTADADSQAAVQVPTANRVQKVAANPTAHYTSGVRAALVPMSRDGHFSADFRVNGRNIHGMVDTGATYVAINISTARQLGLGLTMSDFKYEVRTANGTTTAAMVMLERMEIGSISVNNVEAFVLNDAALSTTLIGMSFMSKLQSYRVKDNRLELVN